MESLEKHIEVDKKILEDPTISPQQRRHIEGELKELEVYQQNHRKNQVYQQCPAFHQLHQCLLNQVFLPCPPSRQNHPLQVSSTIVSGQSPLCLLQALRGLCIRPLLHPHPVMWRIKLKSKS